MYIDTGYKPENHPENAIVVPMGVPTPPVRRFRILMAKQWSTIAFAV